MKRNRYERGMTADFAARYMIVDCTAIAQKSQERHSLNEHASKICSEAILASYLFASHIKGEERLTIQIAAENPKISFLADVHAEGFLRAKLRPNTLQKYPQKLNGAILVVKHNARKELYRGVTDINNTNIEEALHHNLQQSAQVDTIIKFCVEMTENTITRCMGIILERLPPTADLPYLDTEAFFEKYAALRKEEVFQAFEKQRLRNSKLHDLSSKPLSWRCRCSRSKIKAMLFSLGATEINTIITDIGFAEVTCDFCNQCILIEKKELEEILAQYS